MSKQNLALIFNKRFSFVLKSSDESDKGKSYFSDCPRDSHGHCKPKGTGDEKAVEKKEISPLPAMKEGGTVHGWVKKAYEHPYLYHAKKLTQTTYGKETITKYTDRSGEWDAERVQTVHEPIIKKMLNDKAKAAEGTKPKLVMLIGSPGSGKTTVGMPIVKKMMPESTVVDPDAVKEMLPEYRGWNAMQLHKESTHIAKQVQRAAVAEGHNILYDGTGRFTEGMMKIADDYADKGYDVHVVHVSAPLKVTVQRVAKRFLQNPFQKVDKDAPPSRYVDLNFVADIGTTPDYTYKKLKKNPNVKSGVSYHNVSDEPMKVDQFERRDDHERDRKVAEGRDVRR